MSILHKDTQCDQYKKLTFLKLYLNPFRTSTGRLGQFAGRQTQQ